MAMRHSATVGEAMLCASKYLAVHNAALAFIIGPEGHPRRRWSSAVLDAHAPHWAQTAEHGMGLTWRIMTLLSEGRCHLSRSGSPIHSWAEQSTTPALTLRCPFRLITLL